MFPTLSVLLVVVALVAGVGITTVGPGGVFVTAALYELTDLSSAAVAGTASATFVATGLVGIEPTGLLDESRRRPLSGDDPTPSGRRFLTERGVITRP